MEPLGALFGERLVAWLAGRGVTVEDGRTVTAIERDADGSGYVTDVRCGDGTRRLRCRGRRRSLEGGGRLVPDLVAVADERLAGSPITAVHLWFDREIVDLPHAVLVGRVSQWVFRGERAMLPSRDRTRPRRLLPGRDQRIPRPARRRPRRHSWPPSSTNSATSFLQPATPRCSQPAS